LCLHSLLERMRRAPEVLAVATVAEAGVEASEPAAPILRRQFPRNEWCWPSRRDGGAQSQLRGSLVLNATILTVLSLHPAISHVSTSRFAKFHTDGFKPCIDPKWQSQARFKFACEPQHQSAIRGEQPQPGYRVGEWRWSNVTLA